MTILSLENIGKSHATKLLFEGITFGLDEIDRVGLIGANGSGKTTLLRIIAGVEPADTGRVMLAGHPVVGYLPQHPTFDGDLTVLDTIFSSSGGPLAVLREYEEACRELALKGDAGGPALLTRVSDLAARLESVGAWELETNARIVLDQLGITDTAARVGTLSGGQRKRIALAHALIERPDILILDEPTNHLDADTITWLESYLARYSGALLLVTHDRYFLDRVTNRIVEIDRGRVQTFGGNYAYYLEKKEEQEGRQAAEEDKRKKLIRQELAWLRKGAKARTTKQKARIDRAEALMSAPKQEERGEVEVSVGSRRLGKKVIELHDVSKSFDDQIILERFNYIVQPGERIGIIGPNGSGKTTLLEIIAERTRPESGRVVIGDTVVIGYYDQESRALEDEMRVIDYIREIAETIRTADGSTITASQMLERFLFPPAMQYSPIGKLSGGERRRLYLLRLLMGTPNVLLLDEPTNDLDIPTLTTLEDYLDEFGGSLIVVSHDRYFLDRTVDHLIRFEGDGRMRDYPGNYSAFLEIREREAAEEQQKNISQKDDARKAAGTAPATTGDRGDAPRKLSYKERKELDRLEKEIEKWEAKKGEIEEALGEVGTDYTKAQALAEELRRISERLEKDMDRWTELAEFA